MNQITPTCIKMTNGFLAHIHQGEVSLTQVFKDGKLVKEFLSFDPEIARMTLVELGYAEILSPIPIAA